MKEIEPIVPKLQKIICAARLTEENAKRLQAACGQSGCAFENLNVQKKPEDYVLDHHIGQDPPLKPIDVPIIAIAGLWEETDKLEASLALREKLMQNNYRITQIGSRNCCGLLGFHSFPSFMLDPGIDAADKIVYFNRWVRQLADTEKPDVIIVAVPGAIQNLNEKLTKGFGVLPYLVFQAVTADFLLFCTMYDTGSVQFLEEMSAMCKYKFGCGVDCFHMSNLLFDLSASDERGKVIVNRVYRETVSQALEKGFKDSPIPIINVLERPSWDTLLQLVEGKLSGEDFQLVT